ncbi:hypothetical protein AWZ03_007520 [Drosophila navojoa]|uniref:Gustatory receptor n=1 Tax=Drosophila navojoa TaxID=7232 RepID=A0A484BE46_DRONA|nr:hypothetical protein AWZ03_007520 [Drosophila navojoa]
MNSLEALFTRCLQGIYWWMGLVPLPPVSPLWRMLLAMLIRLIWVSYFLWMLWTGISYVLVDRSMSVSYLTGSVLFIGYSMLGLLIQAQTILKQRSYARLEDYRIQLELQMNRLSSSHYGHRSGRLLFLLGAHLASDIVKSWANSKYSISPVHIVSLMQKWQVRFHIIQLIRQIMELNQRAVQLRHSLLRLAAGNDLWLPYSLSDFKHLQTLRLSYGRIYECHELFNDCYGWGLLCLQLLCSFEFVANAYWFITEAYDSQRLYIFIFNGNTCFTIGSLVTALFWYGDASANNLQPSTASVMMGRAAFHLVLCCMGVRCNSRLHRLQLLPFGLWLCWLIAVWTGVPRYILAIPYCSLDCLIIMTMFVMLSSAHGFVLLDTLLKRRTHRQLELQLAVNQFTDRKVQTELICVFCVFLLAALQSLIVWFRLNTKWEWYTPIFWLSAPSAWVVQLKMIAFLSEVLAANERVLGMRRSLKQLAAQSTRSRQLPDVEQLVRLKDQYRQLHLLFVQLNAAYGLSMLIVFIVLCFDFVFSAYWLAKTTLIRSQSGVHLFPSLGFMINVGLLLTVTCWHCQQSFNHSRQIGCLIPKLVKPLGSKRYNDLVSEFLLQTLHQRFVVTAKDFFSLNLHLLSSMFGAVVTYLVILIQFMFAEKSAQAAARPK